MSSCRSTIESATCSVADMVARSAWHRDRAPTGSRKPGPRAILHKAALAVALALGAPTASKAQLTPVVSPPPSQPAPVDDSRSVRVIAPKRLDWHTAKQFALDVSSPIEGQLARYNTRICPGTLGFPAPIARKIVERMREDVALAHADLDTPGCRGNLLAIAARNGAELVRTARQLHSPIVRGIDPEELDALAASKEPARSWAVTDLEDEMGTSLENMVGTPPSFVTVHDASRLRVNSRQSILFAAVVLEWPAMAGKSLDQIADYAVIRTLALTKPDPGHTVGSILALFDTDAVPPPELTQADRAYLRSLYDMPAYITWHRQVGTLSNDIERASASVAKR